MQDKTVLITGASSGIGRATAICLSKEYARLILCGRNHEALIKLQKELTGCKTHLLIFDVRNREAVNASVKQLPQSFSRIDILINNAGNAHGLDFLQDGDPEDWDAMLDINVKGLLYVTQAVLPQMVERKSGHIINVGSTAAKEVYPKGNVYCASKHAVDALNHGMRLDLNGTGVKVGAVHPGLVATNFSEVRFKNDTERAKQVYTGYKALEAEDVARTILYMLQQPEHVNITELVVMPSAQASSTIIHKHD